MNTIRKEIPAEELARQAQIMSRIAERNSFLPAPPKAMVDTYGCQQNEADSEKIRGMLLEMGYALAKDENVADLIILNTCAVREHAEMRVFGNLGALTHTKKANPSQIIAVCGCMVQAPRVADKIKNSYRHVDLVFGPQLLWKFPEFLEKLLIGSGRIFDTSDSEGAIFEGLPSSRDSGVKAWLPIMYGCNNFCSYCIVPYVRGRERSRTPDEVLREAQNLVNAGYKDITLLGQNVNSYGVGLDTETDFSDLLSEINKIDGEFLIRFMTSHPKDAGEKLFSTMASCEKAAKHLHLPFQSGSNRILTAMNRGYTREKYLELVKMARSYIPDIVITSDVIVGFPGETEADFSNTLSLVEEVAFDALFTFIYSKRPGTPASEMPDRATKEEKQARFDRLLELQNSISAKKHASYVGKTVRVLVDGTDGEMLTGRTSGGRLVRFLGTDRLIGNYIDVIIDSSNTWALSGRICGTDNILEDLK